MKVAIEGCCHGALDAIYRHIETLEAKHNYLVDLLLICGDFQAIRNHRDLQCMAVPPKYRQLGDFHKYYTGEKIAPVLTIVIGGNHEASNYLWELYHGGWLAPNIYFLGHAGCIQIDGLRIAGASGIFKSNDFHQGHHERIPYDHGSMRSIYHIREYNIRRLSLLSSPHIFLSHDWPQSIEQYGDVQALLRRKPFFRQDISTGNLGSPPLMGLLQTLRPQWWFSAHLHVRFEAVVHHGQVPGFNSNPGTAPTPVHNPDEITIDDDEFDTDSATVTQAALPAQSEPEHAPPRNPDEITLDDEEEHVAEPPPPSTQPAETKFLALDKCLPRRDFLEVIDIPVPSDSLPSSASGQRRRPTTTYDPEWLAITRAFHPYLSTSRRQAAYPDEPTARAKFQEELEWVQKNVQNKQSPQDTAAFLGIRDIDDCQTFVKTAPGPGSEGNEKMQQPPWYTNPQTVAFCEMLDLENKINPPPS
ncbi:DBR1-domain-containing protein [Leucogyrophana mollusca]|uniref:DBR1-domain-containing protein n=1 Tax=Leucogyrophana mollusca TaxID=85980 RepID=A0ACB8BTM4_9AGAM|nr:DBR1-domain-containing protein [Leucogyrophana mollusca]